MKRYKLLKDLPTFAKGDLFEIRGDGCLWWIGNSSFKCGWGQGHWRREVMAYHKNTLERFPNILEEWFEKIEPKVFWYIDDFMIMCGTEGEFTTPDSASFTKKDIEKLKAIGNYFETPEEAERAVEKLKAWTRLKDKGFEINDWAVADNYEIRLFGHYSRAGIKDDLDLLFGGEE